MHRARYLLVRYWLVGRRLLRARLRQGEVFNPRHVLRAQRVHLRRGVARCNVRSGHLHVGVRPERKVLGARHLHLREWVGGRTVRSGHLHEVSVCCDIL